MAIHNRITIHAGRRFGRLLTIKRRKLPRGSYQWLCLCDCGKKKWVGQVSLSHGTTRSCQCIRAEMAATLAGRYSRTHGMSNTRAFRIWGCMRSRCEYRRDAGWRNYGGRGIKVCKRWGKFKNFYSDMGDPPDGLTLDRKNNNGNYTPGNCKWATYKEQGRNTRFNVLWRAFGEAKTMPAWAEDHRCVVCKGTLWSRLCAKWPTEKALTHPRDVRYSTRTPSAAHAALLVRQAHPASGQGDGQEKKL